VNVQLLPVAGATNGMRCPKTMMSFDGETFEATDKASGHSVRLSPAALYHYSYSPTDSAKKSDRMKGVAALDSDGLVLLDLPGDWHAPHLRDFTSKAGIPLVDATRGQTSRRVRAVLASRAPGWQRMRGIPTPFLVRWRKPVSVCAGIAGLGLMAYLASLGMWAAWRHISAFGRFLLEILEVKWLMVAFSPALLIMRPAFAKVHRWRAKKGLIVGPLGGPFLSAASSRELRVTRGSEDIATIPMGTLPGRAHTLLLYRYDDISGVFILDSANTSLAHLPGRWSPDDLHRFTQRHGLGLAVHRVSREEYLTWAKNCKQAIP
jgi:hypothetical protein